MTGRLLAIHGTGGARVSSFVAVLHTLQLKRSPFPEKGPLLVTHTKIAAKVHFGIFFDIDTLFMCLHLILPQLQKPRSTRHDYLDWILCILHILHQFVSIRTNIFIKNPSHTRF